MRRGHSFCASFCNGGSAIAALEQMSVNFIRDIASSDSLFSLVTASFVNFNPVLLYNYVLRCITYRHPNTLHNHTYNFNSIAEPLQQHVHSSKRLLFRKTTLKHQTVTGSGQTLAFFMLRSHDMNDTICR